MENKTCSKCRDPKPITEFHSRQHRCKECQRAYQKEWQAKNKAHRAEYQRGHYRKHLEKYRESHAQYYQDNKGAIASSDRKRRYGMTDEQFQQLLERQGGCCAICGTNDPSGGHGNNFHVDHDHSTGAIRGLLCHHCNHGLGKFKDSPELLHKAMSYLSSFQK
jgi:hypothetical protein